MTSDEMIAAALSGQEGDFDQPLTSAFRNGLSIHKLSALLRSDRPSAQTLAAYLFYELGAVARPVMMDALPLLDHREPQIRGSVLIGLRDCATRFDEKVLGKLIEKLADDDPFVQRHAMNFVREASRGQLNVAVMTAAKTTGGVFARMARCLGGGRLSRRPVTIEMLESLLADRDSVVRRFAVALGVRPRLMVDEGLLDLVTPHADAAGRVVLAWARHPSQFDETVLARLRG